MLEPTDRLEREVAAAFEEVLRPQAGDDAKLAAMIGAALKTPPGAPPTTGAARKLWPKLVGGAGGLAVAIVTALSAGGEPRRDVAAVAPVAVASPDEAVAGKIAPPREAPESSGAAAVAGTIAAPRDGESSESAVVAGKLAPPRDGESSESAVASGAGGAAELPGSSAAARRARRRAALTVQASAEPAIATIPEEPEDPDALLRAANQARRERRSAEADRLYTQLAARFPASRAARTSRVSHGRLLLDTLGRPAEALDCFLKYAEEEPRGTLAEEALVGRAQALRRLGRTAEMQEAWRTLLERFPQSMHAPTARSGLAEAGP